MRIAALACAFLLVLSCAGTSPAPRVNTISGWVSDASCGKAHVGGKNPECVVKCMKGGAHVGHPEWTPQPMVIVEDDTDRVLVVDNPDKLLGREAQHVIFRGRVEGERVKVVEVLR